MASNGVSRYKCEDCFIKFPVSHADDDYKASRYWSNSPSIEKLFGPKCPLCDRPAEPVTEFAPCPFRMLWPKDAEREIAANGDYVI